MEYNWTSFKKRIDIKVPVADVYRMWVTSAGVEQWFLQRCTYRNAAGEPLAADAAAEKGNGFDWQWYAWPDDVLKGTMLEANGYDSLSFTFGQEGAADMICTVKIYAEQGATICEIVQDNIPTDDKNKSSYHLGCSMGWTFYLTNIKSILEGGIDLRNKNVALKSVLNT